MRVCLLASGSSGNAIYVEHGSTCILIDAGISARRIEERLRAVDVDPHRVQAIVVSHDHSDHISGVGVLARKLKISVWMTPGTFEAAKKLFRGKERVRLFERDEAISIGDLRLQPFAISHDAADPVNFVVDGGNSRLGVATDMGVVTGLVRERLRRADLVVLETNYDRDLLMGGPYPWPLKQRIAGNQGHLGNDVASVALREWAIGGLGQAVLAHLSEKNNRPVLARAACEAELDRAGIGGFRLSVAGPDRPSPVYVV